MRKYLLDSGFSIIDERLSKDDGKIYQTMCAEFSGTSEAYTDAELILGKHNIVRGGELFSKFLQNRISVYKSRFEGKKTAGLGNIERMLLDEFEKIAEDVK